MNRFELNLARRPFTNDLLPWIVVGVLGAASLGLTVWNMSLFVSVRSQISDLQDQRSALTARQRDAERETAALIKTGRDTIQELGASRATFANKIIQQWAFRWTALFNELETVIPYGVRLRTIRPRFEEGVRIRLGGMAKNNESFWDFQLSLLDAPAFGDVYPDAVQASDARLTVGRGEQLFSLEMQYFPEAAGLGGPRRDPLAASAEDAAADTTAPVSAADMVEPDEAAVPGATASPVADAETTTPAVTEDAEERPAAARPNRRTNTRRVGRPERSTAGVSRRGNPLPQSSPLVDTPTVRDRRPEFPTSGPDLSGYTMRDDGVVVDRQGNEVDLQDILKKNEREIRPLKKGEAPPLSDEDDGSEGDAGEDVSGGVDDGRQDDGRGDR